MAFKIGDHVIYEEKDEDGRRIKGEIVDIWRSTGKRITNYFVTLDSGIYVQFTTHNLKWSKIEEPALVA